MQATNRIHHHNKRNLVPLSPGGGAKRITEMYDAVNYKQSNTIVRAGKDPVNNWYLYMPKKENAVVAGFKAASIQRHRQDMVNLLTQSSDSLSGKESLGKQQKLDIMQLRRQVMKKDIVRRDFTAGEVADMLRPLNNHIRSSEPKEKIKALRTATKPGPNTQQEYLRQFIRMSNSDLRNMKEALFLREKTMSFEEQKMILQSMFTLISSYLAQEGRTQSLVYLIRHSPQQDLIRKFAEAWLAHVEKRVVGQTTNRMVMFSWQSTMTSVCGTIVDTLPKNAKPSEKISSPERSLIFQKKWEKSKTAMDGMEPDSPTKFKSLAALPLNEPSHSAQTESPTDEPSLLRTWPKAGAPGYLAEVSLDSDLQLDTASLSEEILTPTETEGAYEIAIDPHADGRKADQRV
mgnify:CR=1 FL=1